MRLYDSPAAFTSDEWLDNHMSVLFLSPHLSRVAFRVTCKLWGQENSLSLAVKFYSSPQP